VPLFDHLQECRNVSFNTLGEGTADVRDDALRGLLKRRGDARPALENLVAYPWKRPLDVLGHRKGALRDRAILDWASASVRTVARPATVVELGCAFGNMLLMLDAQLELDQGVHLVGLDLDDDALGFGRAFAAEVPGYSNCQFLRHDVSERLPFTDGSVDVVVAADVLEHLADVAALLTEVHRVLRPEGHLVLSTPLAESLFKRTASTLNRLTQGRLYRPYYRGKGADLDRDGEPIMEPNAGYAHISEMRYAELSALLHAMGFAIADEELMPVMSGSAWFDEHPALLAGLLGLEAAHKRLGFRSWAHAVCLLLAKR
jgi:SAM-dependent methyltransferase